MSYFPTAIAAAIAALPSASFTDSAVTSKFITGFSSGAGTVAATDSILGALNKLDGNILAITESDPVWTTWKGGTELAAGSSASIGAGSTGSIAFGSSAVVADDCMSSVAIGNSAAANSSYCTVVGQSASASSQWSTALGVGAQASGSTSLAVGTMAVAAGEYSVVIGCFTTDNGAQSCIVIGNAASIGTSASDSIAIGGGAAVAGNAYVALALGRAAAVSGVGGVAIGPYASTSGSSAVNLGSYSATFDNAISDSLMLGGGNGATDEAWLTLQHDSATFQGAVILPDYSGVGTPVEGMVAFDYTAHTIKYYNGTIWV